MRAQVKEGSVTKDRGKRPVPRTDISSALPRPRRAHREPTHARAVDARARRIDALPPAHHGTRRFARARAPKRGVRAARRRVRGSRFGRHIARNERFGRARCRPTRSCASRRPTRSPGRVARAVPSRRVLAARPGLAIRPEPSTAPRVADSGAVSPSREIARGSFAPTPPSIDARILPLPRVSLPSRRPSRRRRRSAVSRVLRRHRLADEGARLPVRGAGQAGDGDRFSQGEPRRAPPPRSLRR